MITAILTVSLSEDSVASAYPTSSSSRVARLPSHERPSTKGSTNLVYLHVVLVLSASCADYGLPQGFQARPLSEVPFSRAMLLIRNTTKSRPTEEPHSLLKGLIDGTVLFIKYPSPISRPGLNLMSTMKLLKFFRTKAMYGFNLKANLLRSSFPLISLGGLKATGLRAVEAITPEALIESRLQVDWVH